MTARNIDGATPVERLFSKLKNWLRIATHYYQSQESYLGFVALVSIKPWVPFVHVTQGARWLFIGKPRERIDGVKLGGFKRLAMTAQLSLPSSEPANRAF